MSHPTASTGKDPRDSDANRDPITGEPGSHPVGTGLGTAGGASVGMAIGAVGGPIGMVIGAAAGGVIGALAGHGAAEALDPTAEDAYWRDEYARRDYVEAGAPYENYTEAYRTGYEGRIRHQEKSFAEAEIALRDEYNLKKSKDGVEWERAKLAAKDAWQRVERALPGDADRDGR